MDLDGDGFLDLISGSWPGEIFFFKGGPKNTFAPPIKLKNKDGKTINVGGGLQNNGGDMILIAGDAKFEETAEGHVIIYDGQRIPVPKGKQAGITGTASAVFAVDWDGDGKLDLLVGDIRGRVWLLRNEGTTKGYAFAKEAHLTAGGKPIEVPHGDAGPIAADWDGDGLTDLLAGAGDGSVWFYRNTGNKTKPELAAGVQLVPPGHNEYGDKAPKEVQRGTRAKICVADWNGDGRLDLLVGDFATQKPDLPVPSDAEKAKQDQLKKELEQVQVKYRAMITKMQGKDRPKEKDDIKKFRDELQEVQMQMQALQSKLPREYENHGWVWLFLRQPAGNPAGER